MARADWRIQRRPLVERQGAVRGSGAVAVAAGWVVWIVVMAGLGGRVPGGALLEGAIADLSVRWPSDFDPLLSGVIVNGTETEKSQSHQLDRLGPGDRQGC